MNTAQLTLNGGEISPQLHYRLDMEKRASSLAQCRNFIPLPYGGVRKRPGTYFRRTIPNGTADTVTYPFQGSDGSRFLLVFQPTRFTIYVLADNSIITNLNIAWPPPNLVLRNLRIIAINDVIILTAPEFAPMQLRYEGNNTFRFADITYTSAPYLDENINPYARLTVLSDPVAPTWVTATNYTTGQIRLSVDGTREYTCIANHTSAATTEPGVGATWASRWVPTRYTPGTTVTIRTHLGRVNHNPASTYTQGQYVLFDDNGTNRTYILTRANNTPGPFESALPNRNPSMWALVPEPFHPDQIAFTHSYSPTRQHPVVWESAARFKISQRRQEETLNMTQTAFGQSLWFTKSARSRKDDSFSVSLSAVSSNNNATSSAIIIDGDWDINTFGTWHGSFSIQKSTDNGTTWTTIRTYDASGDRNVSDTGNEPDACLMRLLFTANGSTGSSGTQRAVLAPRSPFTTSELDVLSVNNTATQITAITRSLTVSGTTPVWSESAFSRRRGFPRCAALHDRRLIFASTKTRPTSLWFSEIEDFYNFRPGTEDSNGIYLTLATDSQDPILWVTSQRKLFIGTAEAEWVVGSETNDTPITPTNFLARAYSRYGSTNIAPVLAGDAVIFVQRHANRIRELGYIADRETYDAADLTRLAEHLFYSVPSTDTSPRIAGMAWQTSREPILWVWMTDGTARIFTYIRAERVFAWSSMDTSGGKIVSIAVMPNTTDDDSVFFLVERNGNIYCIEETPGNAQRDNESAAPSNPPPHRNAPLVYDCQRTETVANNATLPVFTISGAGEPTGPVWTNGKYTTANVSTAPTLVEISAGQPNTTGSTNTFIGGIPITAELTSLPLEVSTQSGPSLSKKKSITRILAHTQKARGLMAAQTIASTGAITFTPMEPHYDNFARNASLVNDTLYYSGWLRASVNISSITSCIHLRHNQPAPCTITNIIADITVSEQ